MFLLAFAPKFRQIFCQSPSKCSHSTASSWEMATISMKVSRRWIVSGAPSRTWRPSSVTTWSLSKASDLPMMKRKLSSTQKICFWSPSMASCPKWNSIRCLWIRCTWTIENISISHNKDALRSPVRSLMRCPKYFDKNCKHGV